jgi:hypothetical protein
MANYKGLTSVLVVAGEAGSGKSTFIEGLFSLMQGCKEPTLWVDTTVDCGILRKLKGEESLKAFQGASLYETLVQLHENKVNPSAEVDWHLAETPYTIQGVHEGLSLYPSQQDDHLVEATDALLADACVQKALRYGWPRLLAKNYRYVVMNVSDASLVEALLPKLNVSLLYLTTPNQVADTDTLYAFTCLGQWHSLNVLMTQAPHRASLDESWQDWFVNYPSWLFLGRLPYFSSDADWHLQYQDQLRTSLVRLNWDGVHALKG